MPRNAWSCNQPTSSPVRLTNYIHYALRQAPCLTQNCLGDLSEAFCLNFVFNRLPGNRARGFEGFSGRAAGFPKTEHGKTIRGAPPFCSTLRMVFRFFGGNRVLCLFSAIRAERKRRRLLIASLAVLRQRPFYFPQRGSGAFFPEPGSFRRRQAARPVAHKGAGLINDAGLVPYLYAQRRL